MKKIFIILLFSILLIGCRNTVKESPSTSLNLGPSSSPQTTTAQSTPLSTNRDSQTPSSSEKSITLSFIGDVQTCGSIGESIKDYGVDYPWHEVAFIFQNDSLTIANLESSISNQGQTKKPSGYAFRSNPESLEGFVNAGIDFVTLGNNHCKDFGEISLYDTLNYLEDYHIQSAGAGRNKEEAKSLELIHIEDTTIGILSYNSIIPWKTWVATDCSSGTTYFSQLEYTGLLDNIEDSKKQCDLLFVSLHWGTEYMSTPHDWQIDLAHKIIDAGADGLIGHHPHEMQSIEIYKEKPILYSIGNFLFHKSTEDSVKTGIFQLTYSKETFTGL